MEHKTASDAAPSASLLFPVHLSNGAVASLGAAALSGASSGSAASSGSDDGGAQQMHDQWPQQMQQEQQQGEMRLHWPLLS